MVAVLLSHPKRKFYPSENWTGIHFNVITKIPGGTLLAKMPAELPSTEQIFTETSRLVPLLTISFNLSRGSDRDSILDSHENGLFAYKC